MTLKEIREQINRVDYDIMKLLNERIELALRTKKLKPQIIDREREKEVIDNVYRIPLQLINKDFSRKLFNDIIAQCRGIQMEDRKLVGFQGEHGSNGEIAITRYAQNFVPIPHIQFSDVVEEIKSNSLDFGMLPLENSLEGGIAEVIDLLIRNDLFIAGEIKQPLNYTLLTLPDTDYRTIKVVYSHPQVLAQCKGFISRNYLEARPYHNAAGAARMLAETKPRASAVIASPLCAALHNLVIIKENVEDDPADYIRYVLLSRERSSVDGDKCSISFTTRDEFGELYAILKIFSEAGINLTRIESRPSHLEKGNHIFLIDLSGSEQDPKVKDALSQVEMRVVLFKLLGCYKTSV